MGYGWKVGPTLFCLAAGTGRGGLRHSNLAFVFCVLRARGETHLLLNAHRRWGDWSLVGGHVEVDERCDWSRTAAREIEEEMTPLRFESDFVVQPLPLLSLKWGPVTSISTGQLTRYRARLYLLRFTVDPGTCLSSLRACEFCYIRESEVPSTASDAARRSYEHAIQGLGALPLSWDADLPELPRFGR